MWAVEASAMTSAGREAVWRLWSDAVNWRGWDPEVEWNSLKGAFVFGAKGELKPVGGPKISFGLTSFSPAVSFIDLPRLPLAQLSFSHEMVPGESGMRITYRIEIPGPLGRLFARLLGPNLEQELPEAVNRLARLDARGAQ